MSLYRPLEAAPGALRFKLFHLGAPVTLSDSLPMLEHMGLRVLDERPHRVAPEGRAGLAARFRHAARRAPATSRSRSMRCTVFEDAFGRVFRGDVENDDFNRLVVAARMPATEIVVLRAYAKYLRQIGFPLSQAFIEATLATHPRIARMLVELFKPRFDPTAAAGAGARTAEHERAIEEALENVDNLSEDRVLRQYLALIQATTRTNFWRTDGEGRRRSFSCRSSSIRPRCRGARAEADVRDLRLLDRASKACTCAAARSRAAACAGRTGRRISAPRCSASSRRRW